MCILPQFLKRQFKEDHIELAEMENIITEIRSSMD